MTKLEYWKRRCELAELVISGAWASDVEIPEEIQVRTDAWQEFLETAKINDPSLETLELYERAPVCPGVTRMRVPGGQIMEYWDYSYVNKKDSQGNEVLVPKNIIISTTFHKL